MREQERVIEMHADEVAPVAQQIAVELDNALDIRPAAAGEKQRQPRRDAADARDHRPLIGGPVGAEIDMALRLRLVHRLERHHAACDATERRGDALDHRGIGAEFRTVEPVESGLRQFVMQRRRKQRDQHGEAMAIDRRHYGNELFEDAVLLLRAALQQRADVERHAHMVEADPVQRVEVEQRQRRLRMRIGRIGVSLVGAVARGLGKFEELDQRRAALECWHRPRGDCRQANECRNQDAKRHCRRDGEPGGPRQGWAFSAAGCSSFSFLCSMRRCASNRLR